MLNKNLQVSGHTDTRDLYYPRVGYGFIFTGFDILSVYTNLPLVKRFSEHIPIHNFWKVRKSQEIKALLVLRPNISDPPYYNYIINFYIQNQFSKLYQIEINLNLKKKVQYE